MEDLIAEFLVETNENLGALDIALIQLEQDPGNKELLSQIFRVMHTIKGTSGFLNLPRLGKVAHKSEDLLGLFRDDKLKPTPATISLILESLDRIKGLLTSIEKDGKEPDGNDDPLTERLEKACRGEMSEAAAPAAAPAVVEEEPAAAPVAAAAPAPVHASEPAAASAAAPAAESALASQSLRVNVDVLEDLMTLVSELVLTRNQIIQYTRGQKDSAFSGPLQRLNQIVSDLQDGVMKTRMQPVGNAWSKLPRIVRDISQELGKKIELEMHGENTELDRQVLEMIKDPLTHMVRNSADHGIEKPADRLAAGKPETGRIRLDSYHEGGHIIIEITDDGKGLPVEKIKSKIVQNRLATEADLSTMTVQQIQQYIFHAGFSTAEKVTAVSGRGVGMDVVRSNIEKIGGSIEMNSVEGKGTSFLIKIPLTLAIVSALIVGVDGERFAIPQLDVHELVMAHAGSQHKIEHINGAPVLRLRNRILPLISLRQLLGFPKAETSTNYIAVLRVGSTQFGIVVDRVFDTEEIVVKPVSSLMSHQSIFSGNTILGDGQVITILDSSGVLKASGLAKTAAPVEEKTVEVAQDETSLLLFNSGGIRKALPLKHVARLEEVDLAQIEYAGGKRVVQYCGSLMPLHLSDPSQPLPAQGRRPVIVFNTNEGMSGLVVDRILDITSFRGEYQIKADGETDGSAIIQGKATDIVNLSPQKERRPPVSSLGSHGETASLGLLSSRASVSVLQH